MTTALSAPEDQSARDRIVSDLDTNLLVEAGAGSGKTTSLVGRMVALVRRGTPVEQIAAVTFTRNAATELRQRFEVELERALREGGDEPEILRRLARAREHLDSAFLGTIHSFCGRLLREHPIEAGLDPSFEEVTEEEWPAIRQEFWMRWLERSRRDDDVALEQLRAVGLDPRALYQGFEALVRYPDVTFPAESRAIPDITECRRALRSLMQRTGDAMPDIEPEDGWDALQRTMRRLALLERTGDWTNPVSFCDAIATLSSKNCHPTQRRWPDKKVAKALGEDWEALLAGPVATVLTAWREHRYPLVIEFLSRAATAFARERHATGRLGFEDLLLGAASLLRKNPAARQALGLRFRHLLVDEFQDTDPIQAEVCFLLASDPAQGTNWRTVTPRPGALFVVGDPKQSIYRFRRADIQTYELVKQRIAACGAVLSLTCNFRSVHPVSRLVNHHFVHAFPREASAVQAAFAPLITRDAPAGADGIYCYQVKPEAKRKDAIVTDCSTQVASWIAQRVAAGDRAPGDFLVLAYRKEVLEAYATALAERNIPVNVTGAGLPRELELRELIVILRVLADPTDPVLVAAALEGLFFGCSPADLFEARRAGLDFAIAHAPNESTSRVGAALQQLYQWWMLAQRVQADVLLDRILDDTGLLAYAASLPLGENRAGTLLHLIESVRAAVTAGASSLSGAIETIEQVLSESAS
ncbi:MAG TPA: UvrD-helicase domain-containing protein, partial [Gemmatimonadales bacterium]|nr:UvrD-helicase domain-containing protein [Gemmatimonadales bacterium]